MGWDELRNSLASDDPIWSTAGTLPDASIVGKVGASGQSPRRGLKFCMLWTTSDGTVVLGAGSATATLVELVDTDESGGLAVRAFAGQSTPVTAHSVYAFDGLSDGRFTIRMTDLVPPATATRYKVFWGVY